MAASLGSGRCPAGPRRRARLRPRRCRWLQFLPTRVPASVAPRYQTGVRHVSDTCLTPPATPEKKAPSESDGASEMLVPPGPLLLTGGGVDDLRRALALLALELVVAVVGDVDPRVTHFVHR